MADSDFQIVVSGSASTVEEWRRALRASASELPRLNREQKEIAKRFGVSEHEYARGVLTGQYGNQRMRSRGQALGQHARGIIEGLGSDYKLLAVVWEGARRRWVLQVQTPERVVGLPVPVELADDVLDSGDREQVEKLRVRVLSGLGRDELVTGHA